MVDIILFIVGIILVLKGADWLTDGSVAVASRLGVSQLVIGLTIVAMGTSMPEFCVSLFSALKGTPDLAVGNVVGSNIFNALLIVGVAALVAPMTIRRSTVKRDIPFAVLASVALMLMCLDNHIGRLDAFILIILFAIFMTMTLRGARKDAEEPQGETKTLPTGKAVVFILLGLAGLIIGSNLFVDSASSIARSLGVSDAVIGLTIVAGGTSLPELATSVVSARKGNSGIAIGNVLGSNVFNILFILGITGLIQPMAITGITMVDLSVMVLSMCLLWLFSFTRYRIQRWEGAVLTAAFIGYMAWLLA
ncbi:MAG: calcium/sodium antiporter [Prevotella sp.]|uniref:calcium/sodium antiporter n=1 Tax=Prevotella sp. AGR2160 TaxID=1280674 RepID=UPI0003FC0836|nr:calcium/sodium antiporter [Prevotella sp. AGR2160]MDD5862248.1 calcium/sodium antiporter [Prevotella sp.]